MRGDDAHLAAGHLVSERGAHRHLVALHPPDLEDAGVPRHEAELVLLVEHGAPVRPRVVLHVDTRRVGLGDKS